MAMCKDLASRPEYQLPDWLRDRIAREAPGDGAVIAHAKADVGADGRLADQWVAMTRDGLWLAADGVTGQQVDRIDLGRVDAVQETTGRGGHLLRLLDEKQSLLAERRYSRAQSKPFSALIRQIERHVKLRKDGKPYSPIAGEFAQYCDVCGIDLSDPNAVCPRKQKRHKLLWRLLMRLGPYRKMAAVGFGCAAISTGLQLVQPYLSKPLINEALLKSNWTLFGWIMALMAGLIVTRVLVQRQHMWTMARLGEYVAHDLRQDCYEKLQHLSLGYFSGHQTGSLSARISHDTDRLWDFIAFGFVQVFIAFAMLVGAGAFLFVLDWRLASVTMVPLPIMVVLIFIHGRRMHRFFGRIWRKWSRMTAVLADTIPGVRVVKAFVQEDREVVKFRGRSQEVVDEAIPLHAEWTSHWPKLTFLLQLSILLVWLVGGPLVMEHDTLRIGPLSIRAGLDVGTLVAFVGYLWLFWGPVHEIGMMNRMFQRASSSAARVFEILDQQPTILSKGDARKIAPIAGRITFEEVSFSYDGVKNALEDVSFEIAPGEMIGLAGPSGGGKTTMINLVCRFYDVREGVIKIDGVDVREHDVPTLRSQIGVVLQEPFLFHGTIAENVAYANPDATLREVIEACKAANAHDFIVHLPDGYDTVVGERGQTLSGGERQRVSIARAILVDPRILILDEATSSVDSQTEKKIQEALSRLVEGRTTIAIAHRLSTLRRADRLLILKEGKLLEQGTHEELLAIEGGLYAKMHNLQVELAAIMAV